MEIGVTIGRWGTTGYFTVLGIGDVRRLFWARKGSYCFWAVGGFGSRCGFRVGGSVGVGSGASWAWAIWLQKPLPLRPIPTAALKDIAVNPQKTSTIPIAFLEAVLAVGEG